MRRTIKARRGDVMHYTSRYCKAADAVSWPVSPISGPLPYPASPLWVSRAKLSLKPDYTTASRASPAKFGVFPGD